jgi:RimJ/RimL family protein N-acetyltransferase
LKNYKCLTQQEFSNGEYKLVPIRFEDRYEIMKWRNEQIYHLRQKEPLTIEQQDMYFKNVVAKLFDQEQPNQILFSFLKNEELIGYGGLVHINWEDKNAEVSFIMDTKLEKSMFEEIWSAYIGAIEKAAFENLILHKVFTFAFDLRPHLYQIFEKNGFFMDARLKEHSIFDGRYLDVVIHSKINQI